MLLHKQVEDLSNVLVKEVRFSDKFLELEDTVKEASSDLTGHFTMNVLNREVNSVSDELQLFSAVSDGRKFLKVDLRESNLRNRSSLLLRHGLRLITDGREGVVVSHDRLLSVSISTSSSLVALASSTSHLAASTLVATFATSTTVLLVVTSSSSVVVLSLVLSVSSHLTRVSSLHLTSSHHHVNLICTLVFTVSEPVEHLRLFTGLSFVFKFLL